MPLKQSRAGAGLGPAVEAAGAQAGHGWQALRANPVEVAAWQGLALGYAQQALPWHAAYARLQALRCLQPLGQGWDTAGLDQALALAPAWWDAADAALSRSGPPWAGWAQVLQRLERCVADDADDWLSWLYLARVRELPYVQGAGVLAQEPQAMAAVRTAVVQAVRCEPLPGETGHLLAQWRLRSGRADLAIAAAQAVVGRTPQRHGTWLLLAQAQMQLGQEAAARHAFAQAGRSQNPAFLKLLAERLLGFNFAFECLGVLQAVVQLRPNDAQGWLALADVQRTLWQTDAAKSSAARVLALQPGHPTAQRLIEEFDAAGHSRAEFDRQLAIYERDGLQPNGFGSQRLLMQSLYQAHVSPDQVADLHRRMGRELEQQALDSVKGALPVPQPLPWDGQRRLRVGYVSGDLHRQHPVNVFMLPVLKRHDHQALEVFVYHTGAMVDEYTRQAKACADHWREAGHLSDTALRQIVIDDRIDVLVDLAGHTATRRLWMFATRVAPVQLSYLGYPHSTGLPCMDWMVGDAVVSPPEHTHLFTEQIARVSGSVFCWAPLEDYPLPPDAERPRPGPVVFGSFNNLLKVDDLTLAVWARILKACPDSRLLLKSAVLADPAVVRQTHERFAVHGLPVDRLELRGPSELSAMMQEYLDVDVALDPFPYNGGTTSMQALWMGCPLVSLKGGNFVSRMGASFLTHLGRNEWLAQTEDDYVAKALALAAQVREQPWSRQAQRAAMQASGLCQIDRHTRELEAIYRQAFEASGPSRAVLA